MVLEYVIFQREKLRHWFNLTEDGMKAVAASIFGTPNNREHRGEFDEDHGIFGKEEGAPFEGAILSAEVREVDGKLSIVALASIDGKATLSQMARGMIPRASIELSPEFGDATCSNCGTFWFRRDGGFWACEECESELGSFDAEGQRIQVIFNDAEGIGNAFLFDPASRGTGPMGQAAVVQAARTELMNMAAKTEKNPKAAAAKTPKADPAPVEEPKVEAKADDAMAALLARAEAAEAAALEAKTALQTAETETAEAVRVAGVLKAAENIRIVKALMVSGVVMDGEQAGELRAENPDFFDRCMATVRANPQRAAGQMGTGNRPVVVEASDDKGKASYERQKARIAVLKAEGKTHQKAAEMALAEEMDATK